MNTPLCLFVYNRPKETREILRSLSRCRGADRHDLYVFADAAKNDAARPQVDQVRGAIRAITGFRNVHLMEAKQNRGLANSIIAGVSSVLAEHGRVIVLEDDLLVTKDFIDYMESALDTYAEDKRIWSISGYSPNIHFPEHYNQALYLTPRASSWGWATWADRWRGIDWDVQDYQAFRRDQQKVKRFNQGGNDMSRLLALQQRGRINSWAIRWCYAQFLRGSYTVYPRHSKVVNQGFGLDASHAGWNDARHRVSLNEEHIDMIPNLAPDPEVMASFKHHQDLSLISKIGYFVRLHGLGYKCLQKILKKILHR